MSSYLMADFETVIGGLWGRFIYLFDMIDYFGLNGNEFGVGVIMMAWRFTFCLSSLVKGLI